MVYTDCDFIRHILAQIRLQCLMKRCACVRSRTKGTSKVDRILSIHIAWRTDTGKRQQNAVSTNLMNVVTGPGPILRFCVQGEDHRWDGTHIVSGVRPVWSVPHHRENQDGFQTLMVSRLSDKGSHGSSNCTSNGDCRFTLFLFFLKINKFQRHLFQL